MLIGGENKDTQKRNVNFIIIKLPPLPLCVVHTLPPYPTEVERLLPNDRTGQHAQYRRLYGTAYTARRHRMVHRVLRVVHRNQWTLQRRARLELWRMVFVALPEATLPVGVLFELAVKLHRVRHILLQAFVVARELDQQMVKDGLAAERGHRLAGGARQMHSIDDLRKARGREMD